MAQFYGVEKGPDWETGCVVDARVGEITCLCMFRTASANFHVQVIDSRREADASQEVYPRTYSQVTYSKHKHQNRVQDMRLQQNRCVLSAGNRAYGGYINGEYAFMTCSS